jgi:cysteine-rich repeat protein
MTKAWTWGWMLGAIVACNDILGAGEPKLVGAPDDIDGARPGGAGGMPEPSVPLPPGCGDGVIQADEECDDENETDGDGCAGCVVECGTAPEFKLDLTHHCYLMIGVPTEPASFVEAREACQGWGGDLASAETVDEYAMIQQRISHPVWMGAELVGGDWVWVDGAPWDDRLEVWGPGEPQAGASCARFSAETLALEAAACDEPLGYVCERFPGGVTP